MAVPLAEPALDLVQTFIIEVESQIRGVVASAKQLALQIGFDGYEAATIALAVSKVVTNALRYANGAHVTIQRYSNHRGIKIVVSDSGAGIANLQQAMQDGYSSRPKPAWAWVWARRNGRSTTYASTPLPPARSSPC